MSEKKEQKSDGARGVAETQPSSAAEAPGGHTSASAERATFASPGVVGTSSCDSGRLSATEPNESNVPKCEHGLADRCPECDGPPGHTGALGPVGFDDSGTLVPFVFTCTPGDVPPGDYQDCWHPNTHMAFWDHEEMVVADCHSGDKYTVICYEQQRRPSSRPYFTWFCAPQQPANPATQDFMREISS